MDITVIRIKRPREDEPLQEIGLTSKKLKNDQGNPQLVKIATVESQKDSSLSAVFKETVSRMKIDKTLRQHYRQQADSGLYKDKNFIKYRNKAAAVSEQKSTASNRRFEIIRKARGITTIDKDTLSYISKSEQFSIESKEEPIADECKKVEKPADIKGNSTETKNDEEIDLSSIKKDSNEEGDQPSGFEFDVIDVENATSKSNKEDEDVIHVNGVPMIESPTQYVYDIYITTGDLKLIDDLDIIECQRPIYQYFDICDDEEEYDSEDSNAEKYYANSYPEDEDSVDNDSDIFYEEEYVDIDDLEKQIMDLNVDDSDDEDSPETFFGNPIPDGVTHFMTDRHMRRHGMKTDPSKDSDEES